MGVVTFTTDFGTADAYAGAMKGVVFSLAPHAVLVDITHDVPRHDIRAGALALANAAPFFPPGTVHVAVVDPGVGGQRAGLVVESRGQYFVGPDNGILALAASLPRKVYRIENRIFSRSNPSPTFHGRDIFAVAAARLVEGRALSEAGPVMDAMVELRLPESGSLPDDGEGEIVHIDSFGNLLTSFREAEVGVGSRWQLSCDGQVFGVEGGSTFSDVPVHGFVIYSGSSGRIEIGVREGSAAARTGCKVGARIHLRRQT